MGLEFFSHRHALLDSASFRTLDDDIFLNSNAIPQPQFTASVFLLVFALLLHEMAQPLHIVRPAEEGPNLIELEVEGNAVCCLKTSADAGVSLENHSMRMYRAKASQYGYVHDFIMKKRKPS